MSRRQLEPVVFSITGKNLKTIPKPLMLVRPKISTQVTLTIGSYRLARLICNGPTRTITRLSTMKNVRARTQSRSVPSPTIRLARPLTRTPISTQTFTRSPKSTHAQPQVYRRPAPSRLTLIKRCLTQTGTQLPSIPVTLSLKLTMHTK